MRIFKAFIIVLLLLISPVSISQETPENKPKMSKGVEDIINLGKDAIIKLALNLVDEKVSVKNFTQTKIMTNGEEIYVYFKNPIKYLPINSSFYFDVGVNLSSKTVYKNSIANPVALLNKNDIAFYKETSAIKKQITFVVKAIGINISDLHNFEDEIIIREKETYYAVNVISKFQESWYKIKKESGEIYDENHTHLEPLPFKTAGELKFRNVNFTKNNN
ncbi:hypothetical protein [Tenacibaculum insulae]|uniref:hypothetical protein n=1 Tax=Tenacibaculum insulae TaxID=2029677 RepID=UPI003AB8840B